MTKSWLNSTQRPLLAACLFANLLSTPGCGSDGKSMCTPAPCPSNASWNYDECTCKPNVEASSCNLDEVLATRLYNTTATDCGELAIGASKEQLTAARDCVATALGEKKPLRLVQKHQGFDSDVSSAYLVDAKGASSLLTYDSDPSGGGHVGGQVNEEQCASLSIKAKCEPTAEDLCIACDAPTKNVLACDDGEEDLARL